MALWLSPTATCSGSFPSPPPSPQCFSFLHIDRISASDGTTTNTCAYTTTTDSNSDVSSRLLPLQHHSVHSLHSFQSFHSFQSSHHWHDTDGPTFFCSSPVSLAPEQAVDMVTMPHAVHDIALPARTSTGRDDDQVLHHSFRLHLHKTSSSHSYQDDGQAASLKRPAKKRNASVSPIVSRWSRYHKQNDTKTSPPSECDSSSGRPSKDSSTSHSHLRWHNTQTFNHSLKNEGQELTREEFEALPVAIRRKYFSTLERLRFAQAAVDDCPDCPDLEEPVISSSKRRRASQHFNRLPSDGFTDKLRRNSIRVSRLSSVDSLWFANLPDKIKKCHFSREEQLALARQLRDSVILDAADEALYKIGRRASKHLTPPIYTPSLLTPRDSMETLESEKREEPKSDLPDSFYDSFRWLEEDEDLDLRLYLDDYHVNLRDSLTLPEPKHDNGPSYRRHLSLSKIPFSRPSLSATLSPRDSPVSPTPMSLGHTPKANSMSQPPTPAKITRRTRTLSLIGSRPSTTEPPGSLIDPEAAHYQDPEARLKLRVYLASPQKFDEAVEFGFPSQNAVSSSRPSKEIALHKRRESRQTTKVDDDEKMKTFLEDDKSSIYSNSESVEDLDSPQTPDTPEKPAAKPVRLPETMPPTDSYAQVPASSREMTLRMTLTRPDLRACEEQIYGWQNVGGRKSTTLRPEFTAVTYLGETNGTRKESMERMFAGIDQTEKGVMKRFWDKVRHH